MLKEWILNQANMRWGLIRKDKIGAVAELIRKCSTKILISGRIIISKCLSKRAFRKSWQNIVY